MLKRSQEWLDSQAWYIQIVVLVLVVFIVRTFGFGLYQVPTGSMETTMLVGERFFADKLTPWISPIKRGEIISFDAPDFDYSDNYWINIWQRYVWGPSNWTKRVIGIPGDRLEGKIENDRPVVYLNGKLLDEPYLNKYPLIAGFTEMPNQQSRVLFSNARVMYFSYDPTKKWLEQPFYAHAISSAQLIKNNAHLPVLEPGTPMQHDVFDVTLGDNEYWVMGDNRLGSLDSREWGKLDGKLIHGRIVFCIFSLDSLSSWWLMDLVKHPIGFWTELMRWNRCMKLVY